MSFKKLFVLTSLAFLACLFYFTGEEPKENKVKPSNFLKQVLEEKGGDSKESSKKAQKPLREEKLNQDLKVSEGQNRKDRPEKVEEKRSVNLFKRKTDYLYFKVVGEHALAFGDTLLGKVKEGSHTKLHRQRAKETSLWQGGVVPFLVSKEISENLKKEILKSINYLNQETSVRFISYSGEKDAIYFELDPKLPCSSYLGKQGGVQPIYLNSKCGMQEILHEIMHALGFVHEQQRERRDEYLEILWENIKPEQEHNFALVPDALTHFYQGSAFSLDLSSVMIYSESAFAKEKGLKTMKSRDGLKISPSKVGLSQADKERISLIY